MNSSQQTFLTPPPPSQPQADSLRQLRDEDVALGCECAHPALQIDCWGEEAAKPLQQRN